MDQENWGDVFVNSVYDETKDEFTVFKRAKHSLVKIEKVVGM
jgi:hypothetical protein